MLKHKNPDLQFSCAVNIKLIAKTYIHNTHKYNLSKIVFYIGPTYNMWFFKPLHPGPLLKTRFNKVWLPLNSCNDTRSPDFDCKNIIVVHVY